MTENPPKLTEPFHMALARQNLSLTRSELTTLQVNTGRLCNMTCKHCHLEAGPASQEILSQETSEQIIAFASKFDFPIIDITGGAPEMNPNIIKLIDGLSHYTPRLMLRSNLTALELNSQKNLIEICKERQVIIIASFPAINKDQAESQRGNGYFSASIEVLKKLNKAGYGQEGSGLELNLVSNPAGAFMPGAQAQIEQRFRQILKSKWDIDFNNLYAFANVPLGRFKKWLLSSGNYDAYMTKLAKAFNPDALQFVMCRNLISVNWDGFLYDCDFNLAVDLPMGGNSLHISDIKTLPVPGDPIAVSDHCYACTAGSGFT